MDLQNILEKYYEEHVNSNSNNYNNAWVAGMEKWSDEVIGEYLEQEGYVTAEKLGKTGGEATLKKHGKDQMKKWGKLGGRPKKIK